MMRKLVQDIFCYENSSIKFHRTKEGKPYMENDAPGFNNFNFNVSHAGDLVVLASEPELLIGVDVMNVAIPGRDKNIDNFFHTLRDCFTSNEWNIIKSGSDDEKLRMFFIHWTLKEAYIKAIGIGLGFDLQRCEFQLSEDKSTANILIDGALSLEWEFEIHYPMNDHIIAIAYGPPSRAVGGYADIVVNNEDVVPNNEERVEFDMLKEDDLIL
eukprot:TRINITY_DN1630_c0_g1_i1.p1 TRINITY_DN1630_c0_g1~~TRINITY_DN1630_c0_g1_i1.p1  ORF type:complete len:213 (-),score=51.77 TRINITY_DN1630_c0_g1_i1:63-701(-)